MNNIPAKSGWLWVKQGFAMLRQQPTGLSTLFFGYMLATAVLIVLAPIGIIAHSILMPVFAIGFMSAAREIIAQRPVLPAQVLAGFRGPALRRLCTLGVVHLLAFIAAVGIGLLFIDFDVWEKLMAEPQTATPELLRATGMIPGVLAGAALYVPTLLIVSFAAPLVQWQGMAPGKALFYSFFAIKRTAGAFCVFAVSLFAIAFFVLQLLGALLGMGPIGFAVMRMVSVLLYGVAHCALYVAYVQIFSPSDQDQDAPAVL
ncbi:hypothetical protein IP92_00116 [Pseudoduganella flava]|uniref:DUF2189 domain-containing protein n=1 Tax=Pseudoduganella flava TaxID=871742 RepID=A0A562Q365_9BURK|nr:BPSS1780 family membrane protein [Pseudoduganella flava]QGZ41201.1 hypothetical protein GO485_20490 [Pseudoduganella flava]TWI51133.1 hypothetical protein IP92_00116 [Pseudoduganella flava]